jgi:hypothetical protein
LRPVQAQAGQRTSWRSIRLSVLEPAQPVRRHSPLQARRQLLSIRQSFFPFASPMLIARNRQRGDKWPVPEPSRQRTAFGKKASACRKKTAPAPSAGAVGKCDRASQQTFNVEPRGPFPAAARNCTFFPARRER